MPGFVFTRTHAKLNISKMLAQIFFIINQLFLLCYTTYFRCGRLYFYCDRPYISIMLDQIFLLL